VTMRVSRSSMPTPMSSLLHLQADVGTVLPEPSFFVPYHSRWRTSTPRGMIAALPSIVSARCSSLAPANQPTLKREPIPTRDLVQSLQTIARYIVD
jgi:hypothetical protein